MNVKKMEFFGIEVVFVLNGVRILNDVVIEVIRYWVVNVEDIFYVLGIVVGFYLYLIMVRNF